MLSLLDVSVEDETTDLICPEMFHCLKLGLLSLDGFCPLRTSHVGGGPFTYVSVRWMLNGITALCRCATLFQHKHASSSSSAARRRKRRSR